MFRILLLLLLLIAGAEAFGQITIRPVATLKKPDHPPINYEAKGAPMPDLRLLRYIDTAHQKAMDSIASATKHRRHRRKHKQQENVAAADSNSRKKFLAGKDFDNGANLFVMMFNPNCSHCEDETQLLEKNIALFCKSKIILLANPAMWDYIPNFVRSFHISDYPTITIGADSSGFIDKVFLYSALPQINIYNAQRKLIRTFAGEVVVDSLKPYIQ